MKTTLSTGGGNRGSSGNPGVEWDYLSSSVLIRMDHEL